MANVVVVLLRGVNVGGHNKIRMESLRDLCAGLGLENPRTHIQSGNIIVGTSEKDLAIVGKRIQKAIEDNLTVRCEVILRTPKDLREIIARNPFKDRTDVTPNKLCVMFLAGEPGPQVKENIRKLLVGPEELHIDGRDLYIYFPNGAGQSKLPALLDRALKMPATARNWNTVMKLLALAED